MSNEAIKYELGLVVLGTIAFAVWQWWELRRGGELLRQQHERERQAEAEAEARQTIKPPEAS